MKLKERLHKKALSIVNKKINKAIEKDVGNGIDVYLDDCWLHVGKDGMVNLYVTTNIKTSIGSIANICKQIEEV